MDDDSMAFHEDRSDLSSLRRLLSHLVSEMAPPDWLSGAVLATTGSGPFPGYEFDESLRGLGVEPTIANFGALDEAWSAGHSRVLVVLGCRDFDSEGICELMRYSKGCALRFVSQEDLVLMLLGASQNEVLEFDDISVDASELVARHPAFAWLEDRFGWSTWADELVPEWNEFADDPSAGHLAAEASGQGETEDDAGEEDESDDVDEGGDEDEEEDEDEQAAEAGGEDDFPDEWDGEGLGDDDSDDAGEEAKYDEDLGETKDEEEQEQERRWLEGEDDEDEDEEEEDVEEELEYDEELEDEAVNHEDAAEANSTGNPAHTQQSAVWANRSQSEQDRFIADLRQFGMLKAFGYTVGAKAPSDATRRTRLRRVLVEELPTRLGRSYIEECGPPNSLARLKKMADSIATFTRNAKRRRSTSMEESIRHWEMDLVWMKQEWYRPGMGFEWPGTYVG